MTPASLPETFRALMLTQHDGQVHAGLRDVSFAELPPGEVLVRVTASSLNYKDGLAVTGQPGVVRSYPMVPGIDLAGEVVESSDERYRPGEAVLVTGWGVGERHWGGFAQYARVRADWVTRVPARFSPVDAMALGTAGLTAMLCVMALEEHGLQPGAGEVLVTGASGGVGSVGVAVLAALGHQVVAATGRPEEEGYLRSLGAGAVMHRDELANLKRPLEKERWAGVLDVVGGPVLAGALAASRYGSSVAACGRAGGMALSGTVLPFILRGVNLLGIDSVMCPTPRRELAWERLARELPEVLLREGVTQRPLEDAAQLAPEILAGRVRGRTVILPG